MKSQVAKGILKSFAGDQMHDYFKGVFDAAGKVGKTATQGALNYGRGVLAPTATTSQIPKLFRAGANSPLPQFGYYVGQGALVAGMGSALNSMDQQSEYSQPMPSGVGNRDMANFMYSQQLQNQKFMHDMALVQMRAESRIPGAQYPGSLQEQQAFSQGILNETGAIGRMTLGTGVRL